MGTVHFFRDLPALRDQTDFLAGNSEIFGEFQRIFPQIVKSKEIIMAKPQIDKSSVIEEFKTHESDSGSSEVQIALLTKRITHLTDHLRTHRKDFHSRRGLIAMTNRRRKLLDYVKKNDLEKYKELLDRLKLRR